MSPQNASVLCLCGVLLLACVQPSLAAPKRGREEGRGGGEVREGLRGKGGSRRREATLRDRMPQGGLQESLEDPADLLDIVTRVGQTADWPPAAHNEALAPRALPRDKLYSKEKSLKKEETRVSSNGKGQVGEESGRKERVEEKSGEETKGSGRRLTVPAVSAHQQQQQQQQQQQAAAVRASAQKKKTPNVEELDTATILCKYNQIDTVSERDESVSSAEVDLFESTSVESPVSPKISKNGRK